MNKDSSGFDFSDGVQHLDQHPDMSNKGAIGQLRRNKTERRRLQDLQRTTSNTGSLQGYQAKGLMDKFNVWMINEGGRQLFFGVFIFLHLLVAVFGIFHYGMKDNLNGARATFGVTFSTCQYYFSFVCH